MIGGLLHKIGRAGGISQLFDALHKPVPSCLLLCVLPRDLISPFHVVQRSSACGAVVCFSGD